MDLVLLRPTPPGPSMSLLLSSHKAHLQCNFLQGSPFVTEVRRRRCLPADVCLCVEGKL